jgi:serine/threonine-protein kinase HipA
MIQVWTHGENASFGQCGALDRHSGSQTSFAYTPGLTPTDAVSVTMPTRVKSWDWAGGLAPIFEMNLPEGTLRDRLQRRFAKATGHFDDLDLLSIVGRAQIGRIRYSGIAEALDESVPFQSVDEILGAKRADGLYDYLLEQFAPHSGIAGVQPKVLVRDSQKLSFARSGKSPSIMGATHIVKMWDQADYPQLAANEFFCLTAAKRLGFEVPQFTLSDTGEALVVERFDMAMKAGLVLKISAFSTASTPDESMMAALKQACSNVLPLFLPSRKALVTQRPCLSSLSLIVRWAMAMPTSRTSAFCMTGLTRKCG